MKVVVIGGGWGGCSAALVAKKIGAEVELYEKTDMLLGLGNVGGIIRNNGRYTAAEELIALGAGDLVEICDSTSRHTNVYFPGNDHASLYDVNKIEPLVKKKLEDEGINIFLRTRAIDVKCSEGKIESVVLSDGTSINADVFIEATGSTGPMGNCLKYGNGCVMCILRCPCFGPRVSLSARAGIPDLQGMRADDIFGAMSGSCKLMKETLSEEIVKELDEKGLVILKVPEEDVNMDKLKSKVCQQYALKEFAENLILLDTGNAKLMTTYYPLEKLRKIPGLEFAKFADPYAGGVGNSIRYLAVSPRTNDMRVRGLDNLFVAGEKSGLFVGHIEAMATGSLAGYNAVRYGIGMPLLTLPISTAIGDMISYENYRVSTIDGRKNRYTFSGAEYFARMKSLGLYSLDDEEIKRRVEKNNLTDIFKIKLI